MFRLFLGRAFLGAARSGKAACFMQRRGKRDVPAVSRARRRIERLRGVQFCRRALEIRSEVSAPARLVPRRWAEKRGGLRLLGFGSGGRGDGRRLFSALKESGYGGLCPHPPRNLRFLGFSFCCRPFGRTPLLHQTQAQAATTAAQRRQLRTAPHQKRTPAVKRRPPARSPRHSFAAAVASRLSLGRRKFPHRRSCQTKPSLMEGSSTMMKWPTSRMVS